MDSDGDSVDGDAYESGEEITEFYDEVKETLTRALSDEVVYNAVIRELEEARIANSQEPATLNSAVIKALIEISCEKFSGSLGPIDVRHYTRELDALLTTFKPLLRSLKRNRGSQLQDINAVVPPLINLLKGRGLRADDFLDEQKQNILVNTLRAGDVIGDEQVQDIISALEQIEFPFMPVQQQATASNISNMPQECKISGCKKRRACLCTGEFCGIFDHRGGRLSTFMSDDYLDIPRDAIPKGESWKISGNIFTSLDGYINFVDKKNGEHFIAPAIHYNVEGGRSFNKFVKVVIHHTIANKSLLEKVTVLLKGEAEQPQKLTLNKEKGKTLTNPWFEIDNVHITVYTNHFSAILCMLCDKQHTEQTRMAGCLFGRLDPNENEAFAIMEFYLYTEDDVQKQSVFTETFTKQMNESGKRLLGTKTFPPSLKMLTNGDKLSTAISITGTPWKFAEGSDDLKEPVNLCDELECVCDYTTPHCVGTYVMHGKSSSINGILTASISNRDASSRAPKIKIPFYMKLSGVDPSEIKLISAVHWLVSDKKLFKVAQRIKPDQWYAVGIELGLAAQELDSIEKNTCREKVDRTIFEMLRMWRDRQPRSEQEVVAARDGLLKTLRETLNDDAAKELDKNGNDYDGHGIVTNYNDSQSDTSDSSG